MREEIRDKNSESASWSEYAVVDDADDGLSWSL